MLCQSLLWKTAAFRLRLLRLLAVAAAAMLPAPVQADIIGFGDFSGFTINQADGDSAPSISPGAIHLTNLALGENRSVFYNTPQNISQFTASVTYQALNVSFRQGSAAALVFQNSSAGATATGSTCGYSGIGKSAAVTLELGGTASGFYTNGSVGGGSPSTSPVNLLSGDPINVTLIYNGATLHENLFDTKTSASYDAYFVANLPAVIGGSSAYVGVTAGSNDYLSDADQYFSNFHFSSAVPEPSTLILLGIGAIGLLAGRWRRT